MTENIKEKSTGQRKVVDPLPSDVAAISPKDKHDIAAPSNDEVNKSVDNPGTDVISARGSWWAKMSDTVKGAIIGGLVTLITYVPTFIYTSQLEVARLQMISEEGARASAKEVRDPIESRKLELFKALTDKPENAQKTLQAFEEIYADDAKQSWFVKLKLRYQQ